MHTGFPVYHTTVWIWMFHQLNLCLPQSLVGRGLYMSDLNKSLKLCIVECLTWINGEMFDSTKSLRLCECFISWIYVLPQSPVGRSLYMSDLNKFLKLGVVECLTWIIDEMFDLPKLLILCECFSSWIYVYFNH